MRRLVTGSLAFVASLATITVLPVYAAPTPEAEPVATDAVEIPLGSLEEPAPAADVQEGTTDPVAGVPDTAPALTLTRTDVPEFSLVGVTWAPDPAVRDVLVQVRVQDADGGWGSWTEVGTEDAEQEDGADVEGAPAARGGTAPLWTGPSTGVEVEVVTRSGAAPTDVQLDLIDPGESAADTSLGTPEIQDTADAATAMPDVFSRAQRGADERIRTWSPEYAPTVKAATLHHTADTNGYTADQVPAMMRSIYRYHAVSRNWGDIGYHVIVDKFGRLFEGRSGGLASTVVGAHAGGFNTGTFGVSMLGNYDVTGVPQATIEAVVQITAWKFSLYGIDPRGSVRLTSGGTDKYARGEVATLPTVFGHRDTKGTACPGRYGYARLPEIRDRVAWVLAHSLTPEITQRYDSDAALRAQLGARTGPEQEAAGVTWQPYQGGTLYFSPATGVKLVRGGVLAAYQRAGGPIALGAPTAEERALPDGRGVVAEFQRGAVYWTPTTEGQVVKGAIRTYWQSTGGPSGPLGYPVASEAPARDGVGALSVFEGGTVMWSPATGPVLVKGGIRGSYEASGRETGPLGYPVAAEQALPGGAGVVQRFQRGDVYWTAAKYGALLYGGIRSAWVDSGGGSGPLGYPAGDEAPTADGSGRVQEFASGAVYWSPARGAFPVRGGIRTGWAAEGAELGPAGYPTGSEKAVGDGRGSVQHFERGYFYWSAATGAVRVGGAVRRTYVDSGGPTGRLGYPTRAETDTVDGSGRVQQFQNGAIYWSAATGARTLRGAIARAWEAAGGVAGPLGLPTAEAKVVGPGGTGRVQTFEGGSVYWTAEHGAQVVRGGIGVTFHAVGGVDGRLGFPTSGEQPTATGARQYFQGGTITWTTATGRAAVTYR